MSVGEGDATRSHRLKTWKTDIHWCIVTQYFYWWWLDLLLLLVYAKCCLLVQWYSNGGTRRHLRGYVDYTICYYYYYYSQALIVQDEPLASLFGVPWSHIQTHGRTPLDERSARRRCLYLHRTTQQTNIHAPSGIRTRDPSNRAAADLRLTPRGHWDRL
jgi:hypothetical protein